MRVTSLDRLVVVAHAEADDTIVTISARLATKWEEGAMPWYVYFGHFLGGVFLANSLPHLIAGITGRSAPTPFASPPFRGLSSPAVNVLWASVNLVVAYLLLLRFDPVNLESWTDFGVTFLGFAAMALQCSRAFSRILEHEATASSTVV